MSSRQTLKLQKKNPTVKMPNKYEIRNVKSNWILFPFSNHISSRLLFFKFFSEILLDILGQISLVGLNKYLRGTIIFFLSFPVMQSIITNHISKNREYVQSLHREFNFTFLQLKISFLLLIKQA